MARRYRIPYRPALVGVDLGRHAFLPKAVEDGSTLQKA